MTKNIITILFIGGILFFNSELFSQAQRNPVLEECTGTWCQWCPCGHDIMEQIVANMPNAIMIGYHGGGGGDPWLNFPGNNIIGLMSFSAYPTAVIDRTGPPQSRGAWTSLINQRYNVPATVDITMQSTFNGVTREMGAVVEVTALENLSGEYRFTVILLEDSLLFSQTGNGSCPGSSSYLHNNVVRAIVNGATGEELNGVNPWNQGEMISKQVQYTIPEDVNVDNCNLVALVHEVQTPLYNAQIQQAIKIPLLDPNYSAQLSSTEGSFMGQSSETANFTTYFKNTGVNSDTYSIDLVFDGPAGWAQSFTTINGTFNIGQIDAISLDPGDSTEIQVHVNANSIMGYGETTLRAYSNYGAYGTSLFRYATFGLDILLVDDDNGENYEEYFVSELINQSAEYGIASSEVIPANVGDLNTYNIIIWNTGTTEPGISVDEMNALKSYLDNGGNLYLNGLNIAYQLGDQTNPYYTTETSEFLSNYLHSNYILKDHSAVLTQGIENDPITGEINTLRLVGGSGANTIDHTKGHHANQIEAADNQASKILNFWLKPDEIPAIKAQHNFVGKVVFTTFGFETISDAPVRQTFAENVITWLNSPVGVNNTNETTPSTFELAQNYPNPFNPKTLINYSVAETTPVTIKVFDLIGREVTTLVNETKPAGYYSVNFDATNLASGVYIYRMISGSFTQVKKMSVLK